MSSQSPTFEREYQALRAGQSIIELTGWSSISISGNDRQAFVHNFCTNDIKRLTPGTSCEAFFTNVKGRTIGHGLIGCRDEELVFIGPPQQGTRIIEHLDRYIMREDVQLTDTTTSRCYLFLMSGETAPLNGLPWNLLGNRAGEIIETSSEQLPALVSHYREQGWTPVGDEAFTAARIEAGFPLFGIDFNEENLPQEIGRDQQAISFTKGCYLGQETVARIDALGHVNQQIVGIRFYGADLPDSGTDLTLNGKPVGRVTSSTFSPQLGRPLALAMIRREANTPGTRLQSPAGECEVVVLPLAISAQ